MIADTAPIPDPQAAMDAVAELMAVNRDNIATVQENLADTANGVRAYNADVCKKLRTYLKRMAGQITGNQHAVVNQLVDSLAATTGQIMSQNAGVVKTLGTGTATGQWPQGLPPTGPTGAAGVTCKLYLQCKGVGYYNGLPAGYVAVCGNHPPQAGSPLLDQTCNECNYDFTRPPDQIIDTGVVGIINASQWIADNIAGVLAKYCQGQPPPPPPPPPGNWCLWWNCDAQGHAEVGIAPCDQPIPRMQLATTAPRFQSYTDANTWLIDHPQWINSLCQQQPPPPPPPTPPPPPPACVPEPQACTQQDIISQGPPSCSFTLPTMADANRQWCDRWGQVVDQVVQAGYAVMKDLSSSSQGSAVSALYIQGLLAAMHSDRTRPENIREELGQFLDREATCDILDWWIKTLSKYVCPMALDLRAALAVRAVLQTLLDATWGEKQSASNEYTADFSVDPHLFGIGGGVKKAIKWGGSAEIGAAIKVFVVPALDIVDRVIRWLCPTVLPSVLDAIGMYLKNTITEVEARCLVRMNGGNWDQWYPLIVSERDRIKPLEWIQWGRRNDLTDLQIQDGLRSFGYLDEFDRKAQSELYDELPTISDHLHWLQRNVFDDDYVKDFDLLNGFEDRFWVKFGHDLRSLGMKKKYASLHYAAHWINPSIGQLAEMAQRLRPGRVDPAIVFQWKDFLRVLAEQDVAPYFRERLQAISYRALPIRQLNQLAQSGQVDAAELAHRWQDIGFKPADSEMLAKALLIQASRQRATQQHGFTAAVVADLAAYGLISKAEALARLAPQGLDQDAINDLFDVADRKRQMAQVKRHDEVTLNNYATLAAKAYGEGVVTKPAAQDALVQAGYSPEAADAELKTIDLRVKMDKIQAAVKAIRRAFLRGEVNAGEAQNALQLAGVLPAMTLDYVQRWSLELTVPRIFASVNQIKRWANEGIISVANAAARFNNLGMSNQDITLMIAEINQEINKSKALAQSKKAKELAKAQSAADKALKATQKAFCRMYTPGKMRIWYAERIIDESTFKSRLKQCGYSADAIDGAFKEAEVARATRDQKAAKAGPLGIEYTGPGADTGGLAT